MQRIYELAADGDLDGVAEAMDALTADELGMAPGGAGGRKGGPIGYHHVHSDAQLSIGIFVLPPGTALPLHDHPGMTVLSKLLFGALKVTSFDVPRDGPPPPPPSLFGAAFREPRTLRLGAPTVRAVAAPCSTLRLDALRGNIHAFEATQHTAIFDVLTPPYSERDGRSCHYYEEEPSEGTAEERLLREVPWPDSLRVVNRQYEGPAIVPR